MAIVRHSSRPTADGQDERIRRKALSTILEPQDPPSEPPPLPKAPAHPVACMQGAFEESMAEMADPSAAQAQSITSEKVDSATRRRILLEQAACEDTHAARWRKKPGERYHPLWKIVSQISFGVHLLHVRMAKSEDDVLNILQTHVDEVDGFLERTTEDFDLATEDINERLRCLKLPLEHGDVFDIMLGDRAFRKQIVDGNEKIEHISNRTTAAMNDALRDVRHGLEATRELAKYIANLDFEWSNRSDEHEEVYQAMSGNAEGWFRCFMSLQTKGHTLSSSLIQLGGIIAELQKRAGIASRKNLGEYVALERRNSQSAAVSPASPPQSPFKVLPRDPLRAVAAAAAQTNKTQDQRQQKERQTPSKDTRFLTDSGYDPLTLERVTRPGFSTARTSSAQRVGKPGLITTRTSSLKGTSDGRTTPQRPSSSRRKNTNDSTISSQSRSSPGNNQSERDCTSPTPSMNQARFFRRPSISKALSFGRKGKMSEPTHLGSAGSTTSLPDPPFTRPFVSHGHFSSIRSLSPLPNPVSPPPAGPGARPLMTPFNDSAMSRVPESPGSSIGSLDRLTSPEPSNTTRSTTPGTRSTTPSPLKSEASREIYSATAWPAKAEKILGAESAAEPPTIKTGPQKRPKLSTLISSNYQLSKDIEMAFPTKPEPEKPPTTLDIGPTKKPMSLKTGLEVLKKPFERENVVLQFLWGGGMGERGQY